MSSGEYRSYSRSSSSSIGGLSENLPPKTLARVSREIRDLHKYPPEGVRLVVDSDTGVPSTLGEVLVSSLRPLSDATLAIRRRTFVALFFVTKLERLESNQKSRNIILLCDTFNDRTLDRFVTK
jgi:hypothetical protein